MKSGTSRKLALPILIALSVLPAFAQDGIGIVGPPDTVDEKVERHENVIVVPEEAKIRRGMGDAPLYVKVHVYAMRIAIDDADSAGLLHMEEAAILDISVEQLMALSDLLGKFQTQDQAAVRKSKLEQCANVLRNGTDAHNAREVLIRLGDKSEASNFIAESLLQEVEVVFGRDVVEKLRARIEEVGSGIMFTKVDMEKFVETSAGGDFQKYLTDECNSL